MREQLKRVPGLATAVRATRTARATVKRATDEAHFALLRVRRAERIEKYLATHTVKRLQLGTGSNPYADWLNTDVVDFRRRNEVVYLDARESFPLPDNAFDTVFSEHMIEHLTYEDGLQCLQECYRVLRPGGRVRIATPSLRRIASLYTQDLSDLQQRYLAWATDVFIDHADVPLPGFVLNNMLRNFGHQFVYDEETLHHVLATTGFVAITEWPVGQSDDPALVGLERHMRSAAEFNAYETLILEARKP
jgi:predicted SAM-dependent methyltransferase